MSATTNVAPSPPPETVVHEDEDSQIDAAEAVFSTIDGPIVRILKYVEPQWGSCCAAVSLVWSVAWGASNGERDLYWMWHLALQPSASLYPWLKASSERVAYWTAWKERVLADYFARTGSRNPNTNDRWAHLAYRIADAYQSREASASAQRHMDALKHSCSGCRNIMYANCSACLDACTNLQPGDRFYADWLACGSCMGCRNRYFDATDSEASSTHFWSSDEEEEEGRE